MLTMSTGRKLSLGLVLAAGSAAAVGGTAHGQTLSWLTAAGGAASTAGNWNPAQVPGAANPLVWNLANIYTVTFSGAVPQSTSHTFKRGTVTLNMTSPHTTSSFVRVGDVSGDTATTLLTTGTLHAGSGLTIGNASGSTGTLTVDNEGALLDTTAAGSDVIVGNAGTGTLTIRDGASVVPADDFIVGSAATGVGTVTVTGTGGLPLPVPSSLLDLTGSGKDLTVGSLGDGFFNVLAGARVNADEMFVALSPGSNGVVNVGGIGGLLNAHSQINVATSLHLGDNPGVGLSGGSSTFTVNDDGIVTVLGTTRIGDPAGVGSGTLTVNQGGVFTTGSLIATDTGGFLNLLGGELNINGGSLQARNDVLTFGSGGVGTPAVVLENGAACTLSNSVAPFEALIVGNTTSAVLAVFTGSHLTISAGDIILGNLAGSSGQLQVTGAGSTAITPSTRFVVIGDAGDGSLFVQNGGHLTTGTTQLGRTATGSGSAVVSGENSIWDITGTLAIGGTTAAPFGTGSVSIGGAATPGGTINVTSGGVLTQSVTVHGSGDSLTIGAGGTLNTDGDVVVFGDFTLAGGTVIADALHLETNNATYNFRGIVSGTLGLNRPTSTIVLTGDLFFDGGLYANSGTVEIGDHTLSIDALNNNAIIDTCHLGPAGVLTSNAFGFVRSGHVLSGDGIVDARISNSGSIVSQGSGLTFTKILTGVGQGVSGSRITFASGGGFAGSGAFSPATPITAQLGSTITTTGPTSMGNGTSSGFICDGVLDLTGSLTINDSDGVELGSLTTLRGTRLSCIAGFRLARQPHLDILQGVGEIGGPLTNDGAIIPGLGSEGTGRITVSGSFNQQTVSGRGTLEMQIGGAAPLEFDNLNIFGPATIGGVLNLSLINGYTPVNGESIALIVATTLTGTFVTENLPPRFHLEYSTRSVRAIFCAADFNNDGFVDFFDYDAFVECFETGSCGGGGGGSADFNGDGFVDFFDYDDFVLAFENGC